MTDARGSWHEDTTWKSVFLDEHVRGVSVIKHVGDNIWYTNDLSLIDTACIPASTFKIPNTLIGLETGTISMETVFPWDSVSRWNPLWNTDLPLPRAFRVSCVPCYQQLARTMGADTMQRWLRALHYGNESIGGGIDLFWLTGDLRISPSQQIAFLEKLATDQLPLKAATMTQFKKIFVMDTTGAGVWSGKTGRAADSINDLGWFVGWVDRPDGRWLTATLIFPMDGPDEQLSEKRTRIARHVFDRFIAKH